MRIKAIILAAAGAASVALPGAASAQSWGGYGGSQYGQPRYGYQDYRHDGRFDRRDRQRWEQRRRWEERQRAREWRRLHRHDRRYDLGYYRY